MNEAQLIGHLGRDPEVGETQGGKRIARLSLGTTERWRDEQGNRREKTEWHRIVVFAEGLVPVAERYLRKGSKLFVRGQITTRKWTDRSNIERWSTEIVIGKSGLLQMLDPPARAREGDDAGGAAAGGSPQGATAPPLDDDVPF